MIFNKTWFLKNQKLLKLFANTSCGRGILRYGLDKVDLILPNAVFQRIGEKKYIGEFRTHDKYSKRLFYGYKPIWKAFHWFDMNVANIYVPRLNLGFDSLPAYPSDDADINSAEEATWAGAHDATTGTLTTTSPNYAWARLLGGTYRVSRGFLNFDTSALTASADISAATLSLYGQAKGTDADSTSFNIYSSTAQNTIIAGDLDLVETTAYCNTNITLPAYSTAAYNDWAFNATGISGISKTGISKFSVRDVSKDVANSAPVTTANCYVAYYSSEQEGTANDPKLVVTYTLPGGNAMFFSSGAVTVG